MRWDNLNIDEEERARLPGYRDDAVIRHFEAPDAVPTRFYEVRAKSILNRVPEASQMPFRWTINPYRGCSHACVFCLGGDTAVLMADGRHKPMYELDAGDAIYGTRVSESGYRRYVRTTVLDKWITIRPAYRLTLVSGTELVVSGDHRFLTNRGWKHVLNSEPGLPDRPHLTVRNRLVGTGPFADQPAHTPDYRRGYLCGIVRGDGTLRSYQLHRSTGGTYTGYRFRLALADLEALRRARSFLNDADVETSERVFQPATGIRLELEAGELVLQRVAGVHREIMAIAAQSRGAFERISQLIEWPVIPSLDWCRGFLAGVFDAEGSRSDFALRISNTDPEILGWIKACADRLRFDAVVEDTRHENGLRTVRIRGGLSEHLRFFHLTDPAITRKRDIEGQMVKTFANLGVADIEPLGRELPLYDVTTGTGDFVANGVVSHNCFARPTHTYLDFNAGRDFEREIIVKVNAPERLRAELARPSWKGEHIALGTNTDPYQWVEGRYKLMRGIWQAMIDARNPGSILTKSPLLLRDLDLMTELAARADFGAALSIPTMEEKAWRATEPHTPNPKARMEAVAALTRAGIRTGILIAPLMPGINDDPAQVAKILELASEAGAAYISGIALHLRGEVRGVFMEWLAEHRPDLVERYRELYRRGAYAPQRERRRLAELVKGPDRSPWERGRGAFLRPADPTPPARQPKQESLFELNGSS
ncbi:MAG TPA: LAGLIDADG family homing endonuclease [Solirubrobacteraceae bacterium]|nr:LAGLIDADG family homing endonuclease [Solirubrobacteraceae bacterium]